MKKSYISKLDNLKIKYKKDPKKFIVFASSLLLAFSLLVGSSYALLTYISKTANTSTIEAGTLALTFENETNTIVLDNNYPVSDQVGMNTDKEYSFSIKNNGSLNANYTLTLDNTCIVGKSYTIEGESVNATKCIPNEYIKVAIKKETGEYEVVKPKLEGESYIIEAGVLKANKTSNYKMKIWLDYDTPNTYNSKGNQTIIYSGKLGLIYEQGTSVLDTSGANAPVISENMIPVYYDEDAEVWKKADSTNNSSVYQWYDYNEKMWANSVTVSITNRDTYKAADPGTPISMEDILTMQVWIPRYKYKVWNYNLDGTVSSSPQEIDIIFEKGTAKTGEITCEDQISGTDGVVSEICQYNGANCTDATCNEKTYTHPAFTFGEEEVEGIWAGKFESSSDTVCTATTSSSIGSRCNLTTIKPLVKPDVTSWRGAMVSVFENNTMAMNDTNNIYGFASTDDTHMMKNIEWGAVAYLSHSKYGMNSEIYINNSNGFYTGRSGGNPPGSTPINETYTSQSSTEQYNTYGYYTYDGYLLDYNTNTKSEIKDMSKVASTTGNIYGIYDMSGGAHEYVMGNIVSNNGTTMMSGYSTAGNYHSGYTGILYDDGNYTSYTGTYSYPDNKYLDRYSFGTSDFQKKRSKLGDAIKEVYNTRYYGWNSDYSYLAVNSFPWFIRGGYYFYVAGAGLFYSHNSSGYAHSEYASRFSITP